MSNRRHVFISHHHADDAAVTALTNLLSRNGIDVRNSSVRAWRAENQKKWAENKVSDETIRRLLRRKISWSTTVVVLIGKETHGRPWVNWEIAEANAQGKRIVGVFERGGTQEDVPPNLEKYGSALVNWNSNSIMGAIDGTENPFEAPGGGLRAPIHPGQHTTC